MDLKAAVLNSKVADKSKIAQKQAVKHTEKKQSRLSDPGQNVSSAIYGVNIIG